LRPNYDGHANRPPTVNPKVNDEVEHPVAFSPYKELPPEGKSRTCRYDAPPDVETNLGQYGETVHYDDLNPELLESKACDEQCVKGYPLFLRSPRYTPGCVIQLTSARTSWGLTPGRSLRSNQRSLPPTDPRGSWKGVRVRVGRLWSTDGSFDGSFFQGPSSAKRR
jgi:hypothetical protein